MNSERDVLLKSFPLDLRTEVIFILSKMSLKANLDSIGSFQVKIKDEIIIIPERVYYEEPGEFNLMTLTSKQKTILDCIFTRHQNGFIRENGLKKIMPVCNEYTWVIPYILRLLGEYVIEILQVIENGLSLDNIDNIRLFIKENPDFYRRIESRVISYWNCYYRHQYPKKEDYIGFKILRYLES